METQDQKKILATDNDGVHLCHKCGWPFPNPHPSARHRRAHKKVCGKIDGHKQIDSEESNHSTCSDEEHVSDDDNINPTPKMMETGKTEKGTDRFEEKLKKSEDEEFGDAAAEFSDAKLSGRSEISASIGEISDLVQLPSTSIDESSSHHPEDAPSLQCISILKDTIIDHKKDSTGDLYPIGSEPDDDIINGKDVISFEENVDSDSNVVVSTIQRKPKMEKTIEVASETFLKEMIPLEGSAKSCSSENLLENKDGGEGPAKENDSNVHVLSVVPKDLEDNSELKLEQLPSTDSISGVEFGEDEIKARNEGSEEEHEFKDVPSNVSAVKSAMDDAPDEGVNPIHKSDTMEDSKETPQTKLEEIKGVGEEHLPMAAESIDEFQAVSDKDDGSYRELPETDRKFIDSVSNSSANGIETNTQCGSVEHENSKQNLGLAYKESTEDKIMKEGVADSEPLQVEGNDDVVKPHVNVSLIDVSADSSSQADSLEGNWGSVVSVFSTRSEVQAVVENEVAPPTNNQAPAEGEKNSPSIRKASSHNSDKSDLFEPPSFMTLVEPGIAGRHKLTDSEIQNVQNAKPTTPQAGWFPSFTPVSRDSDGRKKNEEIIAKVTSWSTGKEQHTPLKNLLGKAPKPEKTPPTIGKDEKTANNNSATTDSILARDTPVRSPVEMGEKKKVKGRPYWAQFVCCTSANY